MAGRWLFILLPSAWHRNSRLGLCRLRTAPENAGLGRFETGRAEIEAGTPSNRIAISTDDVNMFGYIW